MKNRVNSITTGSSGNKTLYARWAGINYNITYHLDDENLVTDCYQYGRIYSVPSILNFEYSKIGKYISSWYTTDGKKDKIYKIGSTFTNLATVEDTNIDFYPVWADINYTIKYDKNGGSGSVSNTKVVGTNLPILRNNTFKKTGYVADGWIDIYGNRYESGQTLDKPLTNGQNVTVLMKANWKEINYTIKFLSGAGETLAEGKTDPADINNVLYTQKITLPECPYEKKGYDFAGWKIGSKTYGAGTVVSKLATINNGCITAKPTWKAVVANSYVVYYEPGAEGVEGVMNKTSMKSDAALAANTFKREGYVFTGWKEKAGSAIYSNKQKIKDVKSKIGQVLVLEAQWKEIEYSVAVYPNIVDKGEQPIVKKYKYSDTVDLSVFQMTNPNEELYYSGLKTTKTGKEANFNDSLIKKENGKTYTFYVHWTKDPKKANMEKLVKMVEEGTFRYFTTTNTQCYDDKETCSACNLGNVVKAEWFVNNVLGLTMEEYNSQLAQYNLSKLCSRFSMNQGGGANSCHAFVCFAEWYAVSGGDFSVKITHKKVPSESGKDTFKLNNENDYLEFIKLLKPGDYVRKNDAHSFMIVDVTDDQVTIIDANGTSQTMDHEGKCQMHVTKWRFEEYSKGTIFSRGNTYFICRPEVDK